MFDQYPQSQKEDLLTHSAFMPNVDFSYLHRLTCMTCQCIYVCCHTGLPVSGHEYGEFQIRFWSDRVAKHSGTIYLIMPLLIYSEVLREAFSSKIWKIAQEC